MFHTFDRIPKPETTKHYLDVALARGRAAMSRAKRIKDPLMSHRAKEKDRLRAIRESLCTHLQKLHDCYPSFDAIGEFTVQAFALDMDPGEAKQALGGLQHAVRTIRGIVSAEVQRIAKARTPDEITQLRNGTIGRISSVLKDTERHLRSLTQARLVFRKLPVVDESLFTVAIAGFPNVGKSTLLRKITSAMPEVQAYAFTTKGLNVGYFEYRYNKIQCIDTPGTLNRAEMNEIERKAELAIKYLADIVVFVVDPTESYPLADQRSLYEHTKEHDKDIIVYVSKTDIATKEQVGLVMEKFPMALTSSDDLTAELIARFRKWI